jgi:hypothetical protein
MAALRSVRSAPTGYLPAVISVTRLIWVQHVVNAVGKMALVVIEAKVIASMHAWIFSQ